MLAARAYAGGPELRPPCFDGAACPALAAALPEPPAARPAPAARPVVISIVGVDFTKVGIGKLEIAYFKKIIEHFKPGHRPDQAAFDDGLRAVEKDLADCELYKGDACGRQPDDYLDSRLAQVLSAERYEIVPVRWSRDPDESEAAVPLVEAEIRRISSKARAEGRPVYLVAHSWGTVLAHTALHRLAVTDPGVRVDRLITLGSPLVPSTWWLNVFVKHEIDAGHLQRYVSKPANVGRWVNLWAKNDYFSNEIKAADLNLREDGQTADLERRVKLAAEQDHSLRPEALRDLFFLKSLKAWHFAYIFDFHVYLKTLRRAYDRSIFRPVVASELAY